MATGRVTTYPDDGTQITTWGALGDGETGDEEDFGAFPARSYQVNGTFGGGNVTFEISNDGTTFVDSGISGISSNTVAAFSIHARYIRPVIADSTGADLNVVIFGNHA